MSETTTARRRALKAYQAAARATRGAKHALDDELARPGGPAFPLDRLRDEYDRRGQAEAIWCFECAAQGAGARARAAAAARGRADADDTWAASSRGFAAAFAVQRILHERAQTAAR